MRKTTLLKTLLVAVSMLLGANSVWGTTTWKTYKTWDFVTGFAASDIAGLLPDGSWSVTGSGAASVADVTTTISSATAVTTNVNNRYCGIKLQGQQDSGRLRISSSGIRIGGGSTIITVPNIKRGQRITVIYTDNASINLNSNSILKDVETSGSGPYTAQGIAVSDGDILIKRVSSTITVKSILVETPIIDAVYTQEFTGVAEKPADWKINNGDLAFDNNMTIKLEANANSRNGYLNILSSAAALTSNNWSLSFKTAMTPGTNKPEQEIAVWGSNSTANSQKINSISGSSVGYHIGSNAFFQAYNTTTGSTTYTVLIAGNNMGTVNLGSATEYIYTVHCTDINTSSNTANLQVIIVKAGTGAEVFNQTRSINTATTGTLGGIFYLNARYNSVTTFDDIYLTQSDFTLSEDSKNLLVGNNGTVTVSNISGDISVASSDESIATASYSAGTVTITGVADGDATVTVYCTNNGVTISKTIDVVVSDYSGIYAADKAVYDAKVENLDAAGQEYWSNNVTAVGDVTDEASYNAAVEELPSTYVSAVKAQTTPGSDMTDAMPEGNAGWTCSQGNGPASYLTTGATETYSNGSTYAKFAAGNIMSQSISGLPNGYYQVQFYGVVNAANNVSTVSGADLVQAYAGSTNLDIDVILQNSCTPTDYLRSIEAQVTDGTLTYGLKVKDGVTDAGNWAVAKIYSLTYLGPEKYNYTFYYKNEGVAIQTEEGYSFVDGETINASYSSVWNGGSTQKYFVTNEATTELTIDKDGTNTLDVDLRLAETWNYTVRGINSTAGVINSNITSGTVFEGESSSKFFFPRYILKGTTLYCSGSGSAYYNATITPDEDDYVYDINYNETPVNNVAFYTEAEDVTGVSEGSNADRASMGKMGYTDDADTYKDVTTLAPGKYILYSRFQNGNNAARSYNFKVGGEVVHTGSAEKGTNNDTNSSEFTVSTPSVLSFACEGSSSSGVDYFYLVKTADFATIGAKGYTTFSSAYPLALGSMTASEGDVTAYSASTINTTGRYVSLTSIDTDVEAGEGLILRGTPNATITIPVAASGDAITNYLVGCPTATELTTPNSNYYVLVNNGENVEFQPLSGTYTNNKVTIPAGKAYLDAGVGAARLSIVFDDEATGISDVRSKMEDVRGFYDLQGRRVAQPTKGLYIMNGKKVIKK
jgi:hypothetical protein